MPDSFDAIEAELKALSDGEGKPRDAFTHAFEVEMAAICAPTQWRIHTAFRDGDGVGFTMLRGTWHSWYGVMPRMGETPGECAVRAFFMAVLAAPPMFLLPFIRDAVEFALKRDPELVETMQELYPHDWQLAVAEAIAAQRGQLDFKRAKYVQAIERVKGEIIYVHKPQWDD